MEINALKRSLAWFHILEVNQVALYKAQASLTDNEIDRRLLLKVAEIESTHIANIHEALLSIGASPSFFSSITPPLGTGLGVLTRITLPLAYKSDIILENRAMEDYQKLISKCENDKILNILWSNYLDESLHTEWFKNRVENSIDKVPSR